MQTNLILNYWTSEGHSEPFTKYYNEHLAEFSPELSQFIQLNGHKEKVIHAHDVLEGEFDNLDLPNGDADVQVVAIEEPIVLVLPVISIEQSHMLNAEWLLA